MALELELELTLAPPSRPRPSNSQIEWTKEDMLIARMKEFNCEFFEQDYRIIYKKGNVNENTDTDKYNFEYLTIRPCLGTGAFDILPLLQLLKNVVINGNFKISWCKTTFPDDFFDNVIIKGDFIAVNCSIEKLPESIGIIQIGGTLNLADNHISLLNSFDGWNIGGDFILTVNQITEVTFTNLKVGGNLNLHNNMITTLNFTNLEIGGNLDASGNDITKVLLKNVAIVGDFLLRSKIRRTLTCENIKIGGFINI